MSRSAVTRRLAAILIADVVGFSRHMERDDAGAFERLRDIRSRIFDPAMDENGGRVVKTTGDGFLVEFASADAALRCAIDAQRAMAAENRTKGANERFDFRIGINLGDIIVDGSDIAGDGVNVAARLEALAQPGGICVSASVREQVHGNLDVRFEDLGEQQVRNISRPIRAYAVVLDGGGAPDEVARKARLRKPLWGAVVVASILAALAAAGTWWMLHGTGGPAALPLAIAIMPLATPDGSAESAALADRITKDLRVAMGRSIRYASFVAATRTSAPADMSADPRSIARQLNARYLIGGDARRVAGQVTVTLLLVDGETGVQRWSTQVAMPLDESTGDASPLIKRLTWRLHSAVANAESMRASDGRARDKDASDLVARGILAWGDDLKGTLAARKLFDAALRIDPNHTAALLGRAWTLNAEYEIDPKADRDRIVLEMDDLSRRATSIDPDSALAWNTRATALAWQGRYDSALEASARAIRLDPANKDSFINRGWIMDVSGQADQTPALLALSQAIDPDLYGYEMNIACESNVLLARFGDAADACAKAAALENWTQNQVWLIAALAHLGDTIRLEGAKKELQRKDPGFTIGGFRAQQRSRHPVWVRQAEENLYAGLRKAGLPE